RVELFVAGLELLLSGLQLLVEALKLLVAGEDLLVGDLQLLIGGALVLDDRLQILLGRRQLLLQVIDLAVRVLRAHARRGRRGASLRRFYEEDEETELAGGAPLDRDDFEIHTPEAIPMAERQALADDWRAGGPSLLGHLAQPG